MNEKHEHHRRLMVMLSLAIVGLFAALLFFGYQIFYGNRVSVIKRVEVDSSFLDDALVQQTKLVENNLPAFEIPVTSTASTEYFPGTAIGPAFSYPSDWHVFSSTLQDAQTGYVNTIFVDANPIQIRDEENLFSVNMHTVNRNAADLAGSTTYLAYFNTTHQDSNVYNEFTRTTTSVNGGTLTEIHAHESGTEDTDVEYLIFDGPTYSVEVRFIDNAASNADNTAWEQIKTSIDFSTIQ